MIACQQTVTRNECTVHLFALEHAMGTPAVRLAHLSAMGILAAPAMPPSEPEGRTRTRAAARARCPAADDDSGGGDGDSVQQTEKSLKT